MNKIIIDALKGNSRKTPIWLMRQAGRYLPEYKIIREKAGSFLNLCYSPADAAEVTMQPIRRFGFDGAIIFSDILVIPHSLGLELDFVQGEGPQLERITNFSELKNLKISKNNWQFENVWNTVSNVKNELANDKTLIGFAGSPWTVATYILEGKGKTDFAFCKNAVENDSKFVMDLLDILTEQTVNYLMGQIDAGAEVIQIFDTWAGLLNSYENRDDFIINPTKKIILEIRNKHPNIPIICFPKGINYLENYIEKIKPNGVSIGSDVSMEFAKKLQKLATIQGNLDPQILITDKDKIKIAAENILENLAGKNFIFNLGHGILPETPIENVEFLVDLVRGYKI
jgi:uroporphyrinogen decarboxylase